MRRLSMLLAGAGLAVVLAGCPPTYPNCNTDDHCKSEGRDEVCVQGQCQECATDANCKEGFVCQANKCVPKPECTPTGNECGEGRKCQAGKCVTSECETGGDCRTGKCENNKCVPVCAQDADCPSGQGCDRGACITKETAETCDWSPVRFDFNEAALNTSARDRLSEIANCIKQGNARVTLEGHADERGTEEYNLQLSNRRAESVKKYLVTLGVDPSAVDTVGFGENRPAASGSDESAWAENRRVEFNRR